MNKWDIWLADVPFEDIEGSKPRPVLIIDPTNALVTTFKITSHEPRNDPAEYRVIKWRGAGLTNPSTIRCSKIIALEREDFIKYRGHLQPEDIEGVQEIVGRELPEYSYLVEKFQSSDDDSFIPDDDPMFDRSIF